MDRIFPPLLRLFPFWDALFFFGSFQGTTYTINLFSLNAQASVTEPDTFIRLKLTHVGLSIIGFATILFKLLCPNEVSIYQSIREYIQTSIEVSFTAQANSVNEDISEKRWYEFALDCRLAKQVVEIVDVDGSNGTRRRNSGHDRPLERSEWLQANQNALNYIFTRKYEQADTSLIVARTFVALGFGIGFVLLLIPSVIIFWPRMVKVCSYLISFVSVSEFFR